MSVTVRPGFLLLLVVCVWRPACCQNVPGVDTNRVCQAHVLNQCNNLGPDLSYNSTSLPNLRGQINPKEIENEFLQFEILFRYNCSNALLVLLCSVYAPFCAPTSATNGSTVRVLQPCRNLCNHVYDGCISIFNEFNYQWPTPLNCDNFPDHSDNQQDLLCFGPTDPGTIPFPSIIGPNNTIPTPAITDMTTPGPSATTAEGTCRSRVELSTRFSALPDYADYDLGGETGCGIPCNGLYFSESERNKVAPAFVLVLSLLCVISTVFTVTTFLIDHLRFRYPERPIVFLCFCYLVIATVYTVGTVSKLASDDSSTAFSCSSGGNKSFVFQRLPFKPGQEVSFQSGSCVTTFVFLYFFQMAAAVWWVILTFAWFLAATFKWGEEAIERFWIIYHAIGWGLPALQLILVMSLRLVDGDQLTGVCSVGNFNRTALGVFVFMPSVIFLLTGIVFLVIGFSALLNIRIQVKRDIQKAQKLGKLIMRIGVFSFLYIVPNFVVILLYIYELVGQDIWEKVVLDPKCVVSSDSNNCSRPQFAAFFLKYLMMLVVGITSCFWVFSIKTIIAWRKFISDICCCFSYLTKFDLNSAQPTKESRV